MSIVFILWLIPCSHVLGQTYQGNITGVVEDPASLRIPDVRVEVRALATSFLRTATSSHDGEFAVYELPVGTYRLTATAAGFDTYVLENINVAAGAAIRVPIQLSVARGNATVTVTAPALDLDKETSNLNAVISSKAVQEMPLNGRDYTQMVKLAPGVNAVNSINGARVGQNVWQVDGIENTDLFFNTNSINIAGIGNGGVGIPATILPIDAIDQFAVTSGGSAEYGRNTGAAINLAIKSGTNKTHGSLYYFNRNDALAATPPFATTRPKLKDNQFGGSIGGPILRNRLFYFFSYERQKLIAGNSSPGTEPSEAYVAEASGVLARYSVPVNPVATNLLTFWPEYGRTGPASPSNFLGHADSVYYSDSGIAKFDYNLNPANIVSFRYFLGAGRQSAPVTSPYPEFFQVAPTHAQNGGVVLTSTLSNKMVNQLTLGANYLGQRFRDGDINFDPIAAGLNTGVTSSALAGSPDMLITGFDEIGRTPPIFLEVGSGQVRDTYTYITGHHQFRIGAGYTREGAYIDYERNKRGTFDWNGSQGPWASDRSITDANVKTLADFLAGYVSSSQIARGDLERNYRQNGLEIFVQDTFHISSELTLNYGLHYSYYSPLDDPTNSISTFVPSLGGVVTPGQGISTLYPSDKTNLAPRFGFAFAPSSSPRVVVRGSSGMFYNGPAYAAFVDNRPPNNGTAGVEANPAGPSPVYTLTRTNYEIIANQPIFGSSSPQPPFGVFSVSQSYKTDYAITSTVNLQYELSKNAIWQVGYVNTLARHLPILRDINQAATSSLGPQTTNTQAQTTRPYYTQFPQYGTINEIETTGSSNYNSLQASLTTSAWRGITSQLSYTYGHSLDSSSSERGYNPTNSYDLQREYGSSDFDIRHTFNAFLTYAVPTVPRIPRLLGAGWETNAFVSFYTGLPFTVFSGQNSSGTFEGRDRVNVIGNPFAGINHSVTKTGVQWINRAAFAAPAAGTFGNEGRNTYRGPGFASVDCAVVKNTRITEKVSAQLRIEMFNLFNRVNLAPIAVTVTGAAGNNQQLTSSSFGLISSTRGTYNSTPGVGPGEPYNTQLALKITF